MPASFPSAFTNALAQPGIAVLFWLEIEGIPYAFGSASKPGSFFSGRSAEHQRLGMLPLMAGVPAGVEQESRPLDGTASIGRLSVRLVDDAAGSVLQLVAGAARRDEAIALTADVPRSVGPDNFIASTTGLNASAYPTTGGTFYCGRETLTYASRSFGVFTNCLRSRYRLQGQGYDNAHTAGDLLTPYPRFVKTRKAALYVSLDGTDAGKVTRFFGTVSDVRAADGTAAFELDLDSLDADLQASVFAGQIRGKLAAGVKDAAGLYDGSGVATSGDVNTSPGMVLRLDRGSVSGRTWVEGQRVVVRVGEEYVSGILRVGGGFDWEIHALAPEGGRGCFNSAVESHDVGEDVVEVMVLAGRDTGGPPEFRAPYFSGTHPLNLALQLLLSRKGDGANGAHDVLPFGGIGIDAAQVDVAGVEQLRDRWLPGFEHVEVLEDRVAFSEWLTRTLRPFVCYPASRADGRITIRRVGPGEVVNLPAVTASSITEVPSWDANLGTVVGRVVLLADYDPNANGQRGPWRTVYLGEMIGPGTEAQEFYRTSFVEQVIEAPGCWTGQPASTGRFGAGRDTGAEVLAYRLFDVVRDRFARPWPTIEVALLIDRLSIEVGDLVLLTIANLPDVSTGLRGIVGAVCEVLGRVPDEARGVVVLTLQQTAYPAGGARLLAPSAVVSSTAAGQIVTTASSYGGSGEDADHFPAGAVIEVWSADLKTSRGTATVTSNNGAGTLGMATVPAGTVAGDVVQLASFTLQPAAVKAAFAFMAGSSTFSDSSSPHVYVP